MIPRDWTEAQREAVRLQAEVARFDQLLARLIRLFEMGAF